MGRAHFFALALLLSVGSFGCGSSSDDDEGQNGGGHGNEEGACGEISQVCHEADDGVEDLATTCHHVAHENDVDACEAILEQCLDFCVPGQGGANGAG